MAVVHEITVPMPEGAGLPAFLALPDATSAPKRGDPRPAVLVIHELLGLDDNMRRIGTRFANAGYPTLVPDFFAGLGPKPICIVRFARGISRVGTGLPYRRLAAAQDWLASHPDVAGGPIGVAGFCMGGGFAILYAVGADVAVVAPFYAAVPEDPAALSGICPTVASYGGRDRVFGPQAERLDEALTRLGVDHEVKVYPDAGHAFMSQYGGVLAGIGARLPSRNGYAPDAAEDAWRRTFAFFERHLRHVAVADG